ncbi:MAG: PKD domain-containing protein, partial [Planctomycetota bacterium]
MKAKFLIIVLILVGLFSTATVRVIYACGNSSPVAELEVELEYTMKGKEVILDGSGSHDSDGSIEKYEWDFSYDAGEGFNCEYFEFPGDGIVKHTYYSTGTYIIKLRVTDDDFATSTCQRSCMVEEDKVRNITQNEDHTTIQAAIDDANNADEIVVFPGTYTGTGNRDIDFNDMEITVRSVDPNDWEVVAKTVIDCQTDPNNEHRGFYFHSGEDANSVLSGVTIKNGYVRNSPP